MSQENINEEIEQLEARLSELRKKVEAYEFKENIRRTTIDIKSQQLATIEASLANLEQRLIDFQKDYKTQKASLRSRQVHLKQEIARLQNPGQYIAQCCNCKEFIPFVNRENPHYRDDYDSGLRWVCQEKSG